MLARISKNIFNNRTLYNKFIKRGIQTLNYGDGIPSETVYESSDYSDEKIIDVLGNERIAVIGYGPQGRAQALNLRDRGLDVVVGLREDSSSWTQAELDGFNNNRLLSIDEATNYGTIVMNLLSDSGQIEQFPVMKKNLRKGDALYFSHGFGVTYSDKTGMNVEELDGVDVILVAPKGCGGSVRDYFVDGNGGINSSYAVHQNMTGKAKERALALAFGIGSPYVYETTFYNEVTSDLVGERSVLMGGIAGLFMANYKVLRENGHTPSEAFNETVEEALQSLYPLINEKGMDYMFANCSTTAQRGAIDWSKRFEEVNTNLIRELYESVKSGNEADFVIDANSDKDYRSRLNNELSEIANEEIWRVGKVIRELRK